MIDAVPYLVCLLMFVHGSHAVTKVRLVNGSTSHDGIVEAFYNGTWMTVWVHYSTLYPDCFWHLKDAFVACRMLNYQKAVSAVCPDSKSTNTPFLTYAVSCRGHEQDLGSCIKDDQYNMYKPGLRVSAVAITCSNLTQDEKDIKVRLVGESKANYGIVEMQYQGIWKKLIGIWAHEWNIRSSNVICRMLGYKSAVSALYYPNEANVGVNASMFLKKLDCSGNEQNIAECASLGWYQNQTKDYSFGAFCQETDTPPPIEMRLVGGSAKNYGQVDLRYHGVWGSVCSMGTLKSTRDFICRKMGFIGANELGRRTKIVEQKRTIQWLYKVTCNGSEANLFQCKHRDVGRAMWVCGQGFNLEVSCKPATFPVFELTGCGPVLHINNTALTVMENANNVYYEAFIFRRYNRYADVKIQIPYDAPPQTLGNGHALGHRKFSLYIGNKYDIILRAVIKDKNGLLMYGDDSSRVKFTPGYCTFKKIPPRFSLSGCGPKVTIDQSMLSQEELSQITSYRIFITGVLSYNGRYNLVSGAEVTSTSFMVHDGKFFIDSSVSVLIGNKYTIRISTVYTDEKAVISYGKSSEEFFFVATFCATTEKAPNTEETLKEETPAPSVSDDKSLGSGAIVAIVLGIILVVLIIIIVVYFLRKRSINGDGTTVERVGLNSKAQPGA